MYQDLLLGLYDETISSFDLTTHYKQLAQELKTCSRANHSEIFAHYTRLADLLVIKTDLGIALKAAYLASEKTKIRELLVTINQLKEQVEALRLGHRKIWFAANKAFGWEILDIRYSGILGRIDTTIWRIEGWLENNQPIEELAAERLPFDGPYPMPEGIILGRNLYHGIISPSKLSDV